MRQLYKYVWGNNSKRMTMKNRFCHLLFTSVGHSACIRFIDNGQVECVSRRAIRRINDNLPCCECGVTDMPHDPECSWWKT